MHTTLVALDATTAHQHHSAIYYVVAGVLAAVALIFISFVYVTKGWRRRGP